ncbi:TPA: NAD(P)-dependent oxidoreductase, partial [Enterobacter kobei]|nr:NAD(P)-dependent oxidoreductase [Enterobacter kobei]
LSIYALTKVLGEEMARQFCLNNADIRITCLRLSNVMAPEEYAQFESWQDEPAVRQWNMWTYVDVRDVAQAIEKAVEYDVRGKDEFFITSDVTCMRTPTQELLDRYYPDVEQRKKLAGNESVLSSEKAMRVLGYRPAHRWTDSV